MKLKAKEIRKLEYWETRVKPDFKPKADPLKTLELMMKIEESERPRFSKFADRISLESLGDRTSTSQLYSVQSRTPKY